MENKEAIKGSRVKNIFYWITTALLVFELVYGALWDFNVLNKGYVASVMLHLGYPFYLPAILGTWKLLGAVAVAVPGFPRLKEWSYAGAFFTFTGAMASHLGAGDGIAGVIFPFIFLAITLFSWWLRPEKNKL